MSSRHWSQQRSLLTGHASLPTPTIAPPQIEQALKTLGIDLVYIDLPGPEAAEAVMRQAVSAGVQGALLLVGPFSSSSQRQTMVDVAAELRLPVMYERREYIRQGGLVAYGPDAADLYRRAAGYVATILAGAHPGDLPIEQPTDRFSTQLYPGIGSALNGGFRPCPSSRSRRQSSSSSCRPPPSRRRGPSTMRKGSRPAGRRRAATRRPGTFKGRDVCNDPLVTTNRIRINMNNPR
jgi:hypothetical protein